MIKPQPDCWLLIGASTRCRSSAGNKSPEKTLALRINRRNTVSVTPAMGASTVAGATVTPPIVTDAGTRAEDGMLCSSGLSQFFFMETFFMTLTQQRPPSPEASARSQTRSIWPLRP